MQTAFYRDNVTGLAAGELRREGDAWVVDYTARAGQPGVPMSGGYVRLEHNPELYPLQARGYATDPGRFWEIQFHPTLWPAVQDVKISALNTLWRLERQKLDPGATLEEAAAEARQWDIAREVWRRWNAREWLFDKCLREAVWTGLVPSPYIGEYVATPEPPRAFGIDPPRPWLALGLPELRAPWSVKYWLTQRERLVAVVFTATQTADKNGRMGPLEYVIPVEKLLIASGEAYGSNFEGTSFLRPVWNAANRLIGLERAEGFNVEIYGVGEMYVHDPDRELSDEEVDAWEAFIANRSAEGGRKGGVVRGNVRVEHLTPTTTPPGFGDVFSRAGQQIDRALNAEHRGIGVSGPGAYAARADASALNTDKNDYYVTQYARNVLAEALHKAVEINCPEDFAASLDFVPRVRYGTVEEADVNRTVEAAVKALEGGLLTHPVLGPHFAEMLDLPSIANAENQNPA